MSQTIAGLAASAVDEGDYLLEVILDLGRVPTARFVENEIVLSKVELTRAELDPFSASGEATLALLGELVASASIVGRGE